MVQIESDSSDSSQITVAVDPQGDQQDSPGNQQNGQQVTAQVAVVQAQTSPGGGQHLIPYLSVNIKGK